MSKLKTVLIKCGGSVIDELTSAFFTSLKELKENGYQVLIVHGGGPDINQALDLYNIAHEFKNGLRKTNLEALEVVEMVLSGKTNRKLVNMLDSYGFKAFGYNGSDGRLLLADFIDQETLGFVGEIEKVNTELISLLMQKDFIPVITPIGCTSNGMKLNINADYAAAAIANAIQADHCLFVTDVEGILIHGKLAEQLHPNEIEQYIQDGEISGGMVPKVTSAIKALDKGLPSVRIVSGKKQFFSQTNWTGTEIKAKVGVLK